MKKRNVMTMALSLAMVGVIGVGSTLAYLTAKDSKLTNTFTFANNITVDLYEEGTIGKGTDSSSGKNYTNLVSGQELGKNVDVEITTSFDTWLLVKVSQEKPADKANAAAMDLSDTLTQITDADWAQVMNGDEAVPGVYYVKVTRPDGESEMTKYDFFETVKVPSVDPADVANGLQNVVIDVFAVQTEGIASPYDAYKESQWYTPVEP